MGHYQVVLTTTKPSPERLTLTVVETQQLPDTEKIESQKEISCIKSTIYIGKRKRYANFTTDTDKLNNLVYRYRDNFYLKLV